MHVLAKPCYQLCRFFGNFHVLGRLYICLSSIDVVTFVTCATEEVVYLSQIVYHFVTTITEILVDKFLIPVIWTANGGLHILSGVLMIVCTLCYFIPDNTNDVKLSGALMIETDCLNYWAKMSLIQMWLRFFYMVWSAFVESCTVRVLSGFT